MEYYYDLGYKAGLSGDSSDVPVGVELAGPLAAGNWIDGWNHAQYDAALLDDEELGGEG